MNSEKQPIWGLARVAIGQQVKHRLDAENIWLVVRIDAQFVEVRLADSKLTASVYLEDIAIA
jgi:hypothetical protein